MEVWRYEGLEVRNKGVSAVDSNRQSLGPFVVETIGSSGSDRMPSDPHLLPPW